MPLKQVQVKVSKYLQRHAYLYLRSALSESTNMHSQIAQNYRTAHLSVERHWQGGFGEQRELQIDFVAVAALAFNLRHHFHGVAKQFSPLGHFTKAGQAAKSQRAASQRITHFCLALLPGYLLWLYFALLFSGFVCFWPRLCCFPYSVVRHFNIWQFRLATC